MTALAPLPPVGTQVFFSFCGRIVKLATDLHLVLMPRMDEAIIPLPHTFLWHGV
jgi:hypothetical protein